jgi:hypothetical protein
MVKDYLKGLRKKKLESGDVPERSLPISYQDLENNLNI